MERDDLYPGLWVQARYAQELVGYPIPILITAVGEERVLGRRWARSRSALIMEDVLDPALLCPAEGFAAPAPPPEG